MKPLMQRSVVRCCVSAVYNKGFTSLLFFHHHPNGENAISLYASTCTSSNHQRTSRRTYSIDPDLERARDAQRHFVRKRRQQRQNQKISKKLNRVRSSTHQFIDRCRLHCRGGAGGRGSLSVNLGNRKHFWRPDGGHGGAGGAVVLLADPHCPNLQRSHPHVAAASGAAGGPQACHGAAAENRIVRVPPGVIVRRVLRHDEEWNEDTQTVTKLWERDELRDEIDQDSYLTMDSDEAMDHSFQQMVQALRDADSIVNEDDDDDYGGDHRNDDSGTSTTEGGSILKVERELVTLADLDAPGAHVVVARGGGGGFGNVSFASLHGPLPDGRILHDRAEGRPGEVAELELELKLIADVGLVGFPNAGKSSLLRAMSKASPEIAPYPFTTLHPLVGIIEYRDGLRIRAADIPGLIEGAADGRGMGHDFLRHIERTAALLYMVDVAGVDLRDPIQDLHTLAKELESYGDGSLLRERRALVVANKVDLLHPDSVPEVLEALREAAASLGIQMERDVLAISAGVTGEGLGGLSKAIRDVVLKTKQERQEEFERETLLQQQQQHKQSNVVEA